MTKKYSDTNGNIYTVGQGIGGRTGPWMTLRQRPNRIVVEAEMTYTVRASTALVVKSPLLQRPVYACNAVQRWKHPVTGEWNLWIDPCLAGCAVRWQRPDGVWTDGVVDRSGGVWRDGARQLRLHEQPQIAPRPRPDRAPWTLERERCAAVWEIPAKK